ncbi:MAG TPA: MarR family transcriptional regulator [Puia sp.]|nr:MarR family transcriptional regulator [Puia sp.]
MDTFELASSLRGAVSDLHKRLRKQAYSAGGLSITETLTLSYLFREGSLSPSELAGINKIKKQSMSQVLAHLEELKLILRVVSKEDKRKMAISLSAAGRNMIEKTRYERDEWLAQAIRERLGPAEIEALAAAIPLLQQIADAE